MPNEELNTLQDSDNTPVGMNCLGPYSYQARKVRNFLLLLNKITEDKDYIYEINDNNEATLILYMGNSTNIKTPTTIGGVDDSQYPVKYIASTCFNYNSNVMSVQISEGVISIG